MEPIPWQGASRASAVFRDAEPDLARKRSRWLVTMASKEAPGTCPSEALPSPVPSWLLPPAAPCNLPTSHSVREQRRRLPNGWRSVPPTATETQRMDAALLV